MGQIKYPSRVLLIIAASSRYSDALKWALATVEQEFGDVFDSSSQFAFDETDYYQKTMGTELKKQFFAFAQLIDPSQIVQAKHRTNDWEEAYKSASSWPEPRPLNLDPGYISEAKLVLASTKDHSHRIYLDRGVFAEVTLHFHHGRWQSRQWTYPDYRRDDYQSFFVDCRNYLRRKLRES